MASDAQDPRDSPATFGSSPAVPAVFRRLGRRAMSRSQTPYSAERPYTSLSSSSAISGRTQGPRRTRSRHSVTRPVSESSPLFLPRSHGPDSPSQSSPSLPPPGGHSIRLAPTPQDVQVLSEASADAMSEIIMAIDMRDRGPRGSTLGCAYYVVLDETLYLLEDVAMAGIDLVETLLLHAQPTTVLISARAPEPLSQFLTRGSQDVNGSRGEFPGAYTLRNLNSTDFRYEAGRNKLLDLHLGMDGPQTMLYTSVVDELLPESGDDQTRGSRQGQLMRLATSVNLDSRLTVGCAGAVLSDIQRRRLTQYLPNDPDALVAFRIQSVEMFSLFNSMFVNADTLVSLQIMQPEYHPNSLQRGPTGSASGAKEGLSLYGLFAHLAATPQGKLKLRRMFLQPSTDINVIQERQWTISFFLRHGNADALCSISKDLRKIKDMKSIMLLLRKGIDNLGRKITVANSVWAVLQRFAAYSLSLREAIRALPDAEKVDVAKKIIQVIDLLQIRQIGEMITETIDFEQSVDRGRTAVQQGIDAELDERKRVYDGMEHLLGNVNARLRSGIPEWARRYVQACIFIPQLGFLTTVSVNPRTGKGNYDGQGLHETWECMFIVGEHAYYKNQQMKELDEELGDPYCMIIDREIEIIHELAIKIIDREAAILMASDVLGDLDSLLALATFCGQNKWTAPNVTDTNVLHIEGGRHALQELVTSSFIPNDCFMAGGPGDHPQEDENLLLSDGINDLLNSPSTVIVTGPNHSGKSVYLKQVAIIVYLAHIGCFVPAERAEIGLTDRILTRIATRESVARSESAFATDLRQVAFTMNFATRRSLIIIDEFGKGTNSQDGAGLVAAAIHHFTGLGHARPKVLVATHFHEIFDDHFLNEGAELAHAHMEVHIDLEAPTIEDQVTYLYRFAPGRSISSFGSRCAAINGVDQAIVHRAESIILQMAQHEDLEVVCSILSDKEAQDLSRAETVARNFLEEDLTHPPITVPRSEVETWYRRKLEGILSPDVSE
ncbi:muts domain V-domain-containing protein [Astrocystis sublimbata]|nr:muts domain V-domain-containing protein [Astrocystis sublimbata]